MSTVNISKFCRPAMQTFRSIRNGEDFCPDAELMTFLQEEANRVAYVRTKSWTLGGSIRNIPGYAISIMTVDPGATWSFLFHSSTHARYLFVDLVVARQTSVANPYVEVSVGPPNDDPIATTQFHVGNSATAPTDVPNELHVAGFAINDGTASVEIPPDTQLAFTLGAYGTRVVSACVYEISLAADTDNGYLQSGVAAGGGIFDEEREELVVLARREWKSNAAPLFTWHTNQAGTTGSTSAYRRLTIDATKTNVVDNGSTTPGPETPGFWGPLEHKSTLGRNELVPCVLGVLASIDGGGTGHVYITDQDGTDVASVAITDTGDERWFIASIDLPAELAKYDVRYASDGTNALDLRAVSVYQYAA